MTPVDLFRLQGIEPPSGDLGIRPGVSTCRAVWTHPLEGENGAPEHRIIHTRTLQLHAPARLHRLGVRRALGYHKCGSHLEHDWVTAFRVLIWTGTSWRVHREERGLARTDDDTLQWFDLGGCETAVAMIEIRNCFLDPWWPCWNLCQGALVLEGEPPASKPLRGERALASEELLLEGLPEGVTAVHANGEVRYKSRYLEVGFCLRRAGFAYLSVDDEGAGRTSVNLLRVIPGISFQGLFLHPLGTGPTMSPSIRYDVGGRTSVRGNSVRYAVHAAGDGQSYELTWEVFPDRLRLTAERSGKKELRAWESSAWTIGLDPRASATTALGAITREGESGTMRLPVLLHAPAFGSFEISTVEGEALWRTDAFRPDNLAVHQLKLGEVPQPEGDYLLRAGRHRAVVEMRVRTFAVPLRPETPAEVARALRRTTLTSLSYRPDTGTLSNNGNSMHCPLCMDNWSALAVRIGDILPGLSAVDLLRDSIERWLDGGPGYGSGGLLEGGEFHLAEDEYLMTGTAGLLGIADFLEHSGTPEWLNKFGPRIARELDRMKNRDLDSDGLVESRYRVGISGQYQWSTCFYDVISFGWKCAFSNALLYAALEKLAVVLPRLGRSDLATGLAGWATLLRSNYLPAFFNPATGWLAGWRCKEGKLHDHAFLTVNGVAVASGVVGIDAGLAIMRKIWDEARRVGLPDTGWGMPASLWPIPDDDLTEIQHGFAFGYYGNGGLTTAQTRHVVAAMYRVGMTGEADHLLRKICAALANAEVFGGAKSGIDGRSWDGWPCGYEGLLTDQFGILAVALDRYAQRR